MPRDEQQPHPLADHRRRLQIYVSPALYRRVRIDAAERDLTVSEACEQALRRHYEGGAPEASGPEGDV